MSAAAQPLVGEQSEPSFDLVEPGRVGRGEVQVESWVAVEPAGDCRRFVGGVVVTDQVHVQVGGDVVVQLGEELFELGGSVAAVDGAGRFPAGGHVQRGEQGGDAVAQVVVGDQRIGNRKSEWDKLSRLNLT